MSTHSEHDSRSPPLPPPGGGPQLEAVHPGADQVLGHRTVRHVVLSRTRMGKRSMDGGEGVTRTPVALAPDTSSTGHEPPLKKAHANAIRRSAVAANRAAAAFTAGRSRRRTSPG